MVLLTCETSSSRLAYLHCVVVTVRFTRKSGITRMLIYELLTRDRGRPKADEGVNEPAADLSPGLSAGRGGIRQTAFEVGAGLDEDMAGHQRALAEDSGGQFRRGG